MSLRGYSLRLVKANQAADPENIGVKLGRYCIANDIPVTTIAVKLGVTRMTIYNWFTGVGVPNKDKVRKIEKLLIKYN
jgi:hypothetical protein